MLTDRWNDLGSISALDFIRWRMKEVRCLGLFDTGRHRQNDESVEGGVAGSDQKNLRMPGNL